MINSLGNRYLGKMQRAILDWLREHEHGTEAQIGKALYTYGVEVAGIGEALYEDGIEVGPDEDLGPRECAWAHKKLLGLKKRGLVRKMDSDLWELDLVGRP